MPRCTYKITIIIFRIKSPCHGELVITTHARNSLGFFFSLGKCRKKHSCKNCNDSNYDKELN